MLALCWACVCALRGSCGSPGLRRLLMWVSGLSPLPLTCSILPCGSYCRSPLVPSWMTQTQLFSVTSAAGMQAALWLVPSTLLFLSTSLLPCSHGPSARTSLPHQQMFPGRRCPLHLLAGASCFHSNGIFLVPLEGLIWAGSLGIRERKSTVSMKRKLRITEVSLSPVIPWPPVGWPVSPLRKPGRGHMTLA